MEKDALGKATSLDLAKCLDRNGCSVVTGKWKNGWTSDDLKLLLSYLPDSVETRALDMFPASSTLPKFSVLFP